MFLLIMNQLFFVLSFLTVYSNGFLLEGRTQPTPNTVSTMTDQHYEMLMYLLMEERRARRSQDKMITELRQELLKTQQAVTQKYLQSKQDNSTNPFEICADLVNDTVALNRSLVLMVQEFSSMKQVNTQLKHNYDLLLERADQLQKNNTILVLKVQQVKTRMDSVMQLKTIADLQNVNNALNETNHLALEIQKTNGKLLSLENSEEARKQDFFALLSKAEFTERSLKNTTMLFDQRWKSLTDRGKDSSHYDV